MSNKPTLWFLAARSNPMCHPGMKRKHMMITNSLFCNLQSALKRKTAWAEPSGKCHSSGNSFLVHIFKERAESSVLNALKCLLYDIMRVSLPRMHIDTCGELTGAANPRKVLPIQSIRDKANTQRSRPVKWTLGNCSPDSFTSLSHLTADVINWQLKLRSHPTLWSMHEYYSHSDELWQSGSQPIAALNISSFCLPFSSRDFSKLFVKAYWPIYLHLNIRRGNHWRTSCG